MLTVSELFIYPIKSLGGIPVLSAKLTDRGFQHDRRWMLVDQDNHFLTQRDLASMALLQTEITENGLKVFHKLKREEMIMIPFIPETMETSTIKVWTDSCKLQFVGGNADEWFSGQLSLKCRLVFMPHSTHRRVDSRYASNRQITSLSDGYPLMMLGQASLDDLNSRLSEPVPVNRFRPNIVIAGGTPYEEDSMKHFSINLVDFYGVKGCARCIIPTIHQDTAERSKDPLRTLATYRTKNNNIYFGQNLLYDSEGVIHVGDEVVREL